VSEERISVIPLGYDADVFSPIPSGEGRSEQPSPRPYLLHVGQAYPHKNLQRLIRAFAQVAPLHPDLKLVLAGKPHPTETPRLRQLILELGLEGRVECRAYVPFATLPELYRGALALVYPSLWEGFGLPVLEAMACGTPVITSLGSGTEEVAEGAALLVDPTDTAGLAQALRDLLENRPLREQLRAQGLQRARRFSWAGTAFETSTLLQGLMG